MARARGGFAWLEESRWDVTALLGREGKGGGDRSTDLDGGMAGSVILRGWLVGMVGCLWLLDDCLWMVSWVSRDCMYVEGRTYM